MIISGVIIAESPIYQGNSKKTIFTRQGDGTHRLVSLAGQISGSAQALMDAFIGQSRNQKNIGLLNELWKRLYGEDMPPGLIKRVDCKLQEESYLKDRLFDLRMGIKLDDDRWAAEANANYKMETVMKHAAFDFRMEVKDAELTRNENDAKLYYVLQELIQGRFWFGAGKSKGLGRLRFEGELRLKQPDTEPETLVDTNHLRTDIEFSAANPVLVGWNWGKVDANVPAFQSIQGRYLIEALKEIPDVIRERLEMVAHGPILNPEDWKQKIADFLPRITAAWLNSRSGEEHISYKLTEPGIKRLQKGKHGMSDKLLAKIEPLAEQPFESPEQAEAAFAKRLGKKANMAKRVIKELEEVTETVSTLDDSAWNEIAGSFGFDDNIKKELEACGQDETKIIRILTPAFNKVLPQIFQQVDHHIKLVQSDVWVDHEIANREDHLSIKKMLLDGKITQSDWDNPDFTPSGISSDAWQEFKQSHDRIQFRFLLNTNNLKKSISNDETQIALLKWYRESTRQELSQPHHIDFRAGGPNNREISKKYGKPYDTIFMRMLSFRGSPQQEGQWEIYIPGATIKGAFRKRATMVLRTLWGESSKTQNLLDLLFGTQGQRGLLFFSDAYLKNPDNPAQNWCSMDGIKMDPRTGQPIEASKRDYLYACGDQLLFQLRIDTQDITMDNMEAIRVFQHLLQDFKKGDIPLGGDKTSGFGWVQAELSTLEFLTGGETKLTRELFGSLPLARQGIWKALILKNNDAWEAMKPKAPLLQETKNASETPPIAKGGFVSHRAFGGYCGTLVIEAETLTPVNIQESGDPSFKTTIDDEPVNGWDFFSLSPPANNDRLKDRTYAIPGRSIKGMVRHIYSIASDSQNESVDIRYLNPADSLFGWVGDAPNQAIMGRLVFDTAKFENSDLEWFKVPYPYGEWYFKNGRWHNEAGATAKQLVIADQWRLFPHAPLAPVVKKLDNFKPDTVKASFIRTIKPGFKARFSLRFWNLTEEELQRMAWCIALEPGLAHKIGNHRYLGFGSIRLHILPESFLIDWSRRYEIKNSAEGYKPFKPDQWCKPDGISHYKILKEALSADQL